MTEQQFAEFMALLKEQHRVMHEIAGITLAGVNEATYYLRMLHEYNQAMAEAEAEDLDPEQKLKDSGTFYAVRLIKKGTELGIMFYASHPEAQRPTGKLYWDKKGIEPAGLLDWENGPVWKQKSTPTKDELAEIPGMLRPLGGTITFIKTRYEAKNGGYDRWPIEKIVSWVPDNAPAATATPAPAPTRPAPPQPKQQSTIPGPPPPQQQPATPPSAIDGLKALVQDAKKKYVQTVGIAIKTSNEATVNAACDFIAEKWALAEGNKLGFKDGRTTVTTSDLSSNQLDALTAHVKAHADYWLDKWRTV